MRLEQTPCGLNEYIYMRPLFVWMYGFMIPDGGFFARGWGILCGGKEDFVRVVREYC